MKNSHRFSLVLFALLAIVVCGAVLPFRQVSVVSTSAQVSEPARLPIFRLAAPVVNEETVRQQAQATLGISGPISKLDSRLAIRSGSQLVDVNTRSGGIWAADQAQMWNPRLKPSLPNSERARGIADGFVKKNNLLPAVDKNQYYSVSFVSVGGTQAAFFDPASKKRSDRKLDVQVNYGVKMNIEGLHDVPLTGGGGEFNVTLGDQGKVIGYQGLWRPIEAVETESPVIPKEKADEQFKEMTKALELTSYSSSLAYYSAPPSVQQRYLYPVYVYRATAQYGKQRVPLRLITIPATEFGPKLTQPAAVKPRPANSTPTRRSLIPEAMKEKQSRPDRQNHAAFQSSWREAGSSYIGTSGGLSGSQNNAQGFVNNLSADGWSINFLWGDANAWESDWRRNNDQWVDAADFVFYTGHANMNGWVLSNPDDTFLDVSEVGPGPECPGDMWGQQDLEWVVIAACGPLQDDLISPGGGDVFRWAGAFDGLHQLLGYGAITYDNEQEGASLTQYAIAGDTLINSWFRAAREIQPSDNGASPPDGPTVWVGVMYVGKAGADPSGDHVWGHGSTSADPCGPTFYVAMWTTC